MNYNKFLKWFIRAETAIVIWLFIIAYITAQTNAVILTMGTSAAVIFYVWATNNLKNNPV